jgi:tight adherence protein B
MVIWFRETIAAAGFAQFGQTAVGFAIAFLGLVAGAVSFEVTHVPAFAASVAVITIAFALELLTLRARFRRRAISLVWPEVIDSLVSAASSGMSMNEAFLELSASGPQLLRPNFSKVEADVDAGATLTGALCRLRDELAEVHVDRLVELVRIVSVAGGEGFYSALRAQGQQIRDDLALRGELESKQGWVSGTAKVAVIAPWLIVAMLCSRPENVESYASAAGSGILLLGLAISIFAYRLIQLLGRVSQPTRVFYQ